MFGWKPFAITAFGLTIDCSVNVAMGWPAAFALAVTCWRFGPIVALVPAALKVWQPPQPEEANTVFPAAAFPLTGFAVVVCGVEPCTVWGVGETTWALPHPAATAAIPRRTSVGRRTAASVTLQVS